MTRFSLAHIWSFLSMIQIWLSRTSTLKRREPSIRITHSNIGIKTPIHLYFSTFILTAIHCHTNNQKQKKNTKKKYKKKNIKIIFNQNIHITDSRWSDLKIIQFIIQFLFHFFILKTIFHFISNYSNIQFDFEFLFYSTLLEILYHHTN